ncbi:hypothetical protein LY76DRAFT_605432 [Colletotrichum caudatum]|nr:hypothetical protein LY76DRAFT_605432 [Colletotrichum caudatum]
MGIIQRGASIVSAAQAQAEASDTSERLLLTAVSAGYKVSAGPCQPAAAPGFPRTSTSWIFGATSAIGKIKGLSMSQVHDAFGSPARSGAGVTGMSRITRGTREFLRVQSSEVDAVGLVDNLCVVARVTGRGLPENITGRLARAGYGVVGEPSQNKRPLKTIAGVNPAFIIK